MNHVGVVTQKCCRHFPQRDGMRSNGVMWEERSNMRHAAGSNRFRKEHTIKEFNVSQFDFPHFEKHIIVRIIKWAAVEIAGYRNDACWSCQVPLALPWAGCTLISTTPRFTVPFCVKRHDAFLVSPLDWPTPSRPAAWTHYCLGWSPPKQRCTYPLNAITRPEEIQLRWCFMGASRDKVDTCGMKGWLTLLRRRGWRGLFGHSLDIVKWPRMKAHSFAAAKVPILLDKDQIVISCPEGISPVN